MKTKTNHLTVQDFEAIFLVCQGLCTDEAYKLLREIGIQGATFNLLEEPFGTHQIAAIQHIYGPSYLCEKVSIEFLGGYSGNVVHTGDLSMFVCQKIVSEYYYWGDASGITKLGLEHIL